MAYTLQIYDNDQVTNEYRVNQTFINGSQVLTEAVNQFNDVIIPITYSPDLKGLSYVIDNFDTLLSDELSSLSNIVNIINVSDYLDIPTLYDRYAQAMIEYLKNYKNWIDDKDNNLAILSDLNPNVELAMLKHLQYFDIVQCLIDIKELQKVYRDTPQKYMYDGRYKYDNLKNDMIRKLTINQNLSIFSSLGKLFLVKKPCNIEYLNFVDYSYMGHTKTTRIASGKHMARDETKYYSGEDVYDLNNNKLYNIFPRGSFRTIFVSPNLNVIVYTETNRKILHYYDLVSQTIKGSFAIDGIAKDLDFNILFSPNERYIGINRERRPHDYELIIIDIVTQNIIVNGISSDISMALTNDGYYINDTDFSYTSYNGRITVKQPIAVMSSHMFSGTYNDLLIIINNKLLHLTIHTPNSIQQYMDNVEDNQVIMYDDEEKEETRRLLFEYRQSHK